MYHAKAAGKNECRVFTEQMDVGLRERLELRQSLQLALERDEFVLHY